MFSSLFLAFSERPLPHYIFFNLGSTIFLTESPRKFAPNTARVIPRPGAMHNHGYDSRLPRFSARSLPHDGTGGGTPRPRKLSVASATKAVDRRAVAYTIQGARQFGAMCRITMRNLEQPVTMADSMYGMFLTLIAADRVRRLILGP